MKKKIFCLTMAMLMLINCIGFTTSVKAVSFTDVSTTHWAWEYIYKMQAVNIINGYEDGTFKPENQVKVGEFIKMIAMATYGRVDTTQTNSLNGTHWAMPYVSVLDMIALNKADYNDEILEQVITREHAANILCKFYFYTAEEDLKLDREENYIKNMADENLITDKYNRLYINNCIKYELINGFPDGTFRPNEGLTRAQAAKVISLALDK